MILPKIHIRSFAIFLALFSLAFIPSVKSFAQNIRLDTDTIQTGVSALSSPDTVLQGGLTPLSTFGHATSLSAQPLAALAYCGDGVKDEGEECDGSDVGLENCQTQGFDGGALGCRADCTLDTSACTNEVPEHTNEAAQNSTGNETGERGGGRGSGGPGRGGGSFANTTESSSPAHVVATNSASESEEQQELAQDDDTKQETEAQEEGGSVHTTQSPSPSREIISNASEPIEKPVTTTQGSAPTGSWAPQAPMYVAVTSPPTTTANVLSETIELPEAASVSPPPSPTENEQEEAEHDFPVNSLTASLIQSNAQANNIGLSVMIVVDAIIITRLVTLRGVRKRRRAQRNVLQ